MTRRRISECTAFVISDAERVVVYKLDEPRTQPLALLGTGATIWQVLVGEEPDLRPWREESDMLADLADAYGVTPAEISDDVIDFLQRMTTAGYVEASSPAAEIG